MDRLSYKYPVPNQTIMFDNIVDKEKYLNGTWLSIPTKLMILITGFLDHKCKYGSQVEKKLYKSMNEKDMILRLFEKRPLSFVGFADCYTLKDGTTGSGNWDTIGTDSESAPLVLENYMSYDEIEIAAFLTFSCYTQFINNGSRFNSAIPGSEGTFEPEGILMGQVGARFQVRKHMEWRYMIIDNGQNTRSNGYGRDNNSIIGKYLKLWADFYDIEYFPTYEEAMAEPLKYFGPVVDLSTGIGSGLNIQVYRKRLRYNAIVFLEDANDRAMTTGSMAFCHVVGLGLGVWAIDRKLQQEITVSVYLDILQERDLNYISDLYFAWFYEITGDTKAIKNTNIHFGKREPSDALRPVSGLQRGQDRVAGPKLLVANWAWDANSYIGNEYWDRYLSSSGDPAAACSSFVAYYGNPDLYPIRVIKTWS